MPRPCEPPVGLYISVRRPVLPLFALSAGWINRPHTAALWARLPPELRGALPCRLFAAMARGVATLSSARLCRTVLDCRLGVTAALSDGVLLAPKRAHVAATAARCSGSRKVHLHGSSRMLY